MKYHRSIAFHCGWWRTVCIQMSGGLSTGKTGKEKSRIRGRAKTMKTWKKKSGSGSYVGSDHLKGFRSWKLRSIVLGGRRGASERPRYRIILACRVEFQSCFEALLVDGKVLLLGSDQVNEG
jgi:hypothetical protein